MKPKCDACPSDATSVLTFLCPTEHVRSYVMCFECASVVIIGHVMGRKGGCATCSGLTTPVAVNPIAADLNGFDALCEAAREDMQDAAAMGGPLG